MPDNNLVNLLSAPLIHKFVVKGKPSRVVVNGNCLLWENESATKSRTVIPLNQVISLMPCFCETPLPDSLTCTCITSNKNRTWPNSPNSAQHLKLNFIRLYYAVTVRKYGWKINYMPLYVHSDTGDSSQLHEWITNVRSLLDEFNRPRRLIVFINPYGGRKKAPSIYNKKVLPIFQLANVEVECITTDRANHAKDMISDLNVSLDKYDGIICVGGDGMYAELLNGLLIRTNTEFGLKYSSPKTELMSPTIPIGVIPAGSTDAVAFSVSGQNDPAAMAIHIVFGKTVGVDVSAVHSNNNDEEKLLRYATSFLGYGYFGDTISDSEKNRWMGPSRYDWAGAKKIMGHRLYSGQLKLYVSTNDGSPTDTVICTSDCPLCAKAAIRSKANRSLVNRNNNNEESVVTITGKFLAINAATMTCVCGKTKKGMSPAAHLGNGCTDLILVSQCSRADYLKYMMRTGFLSESPFDLEFVDVYRVKEFEFTPIADPSGKSNSYRVSNASVWNCDGEIISDPAIHVKVHCQLVSVFGTGRENRDENIGLCKPRLPKRVGDMNLKTTTAWNNNDNATINTSLKA